jgi:hypothetical protein
MSGSSQHRPNGPSRLIDWRNYRDARPVTQGAGCSNVHPNNRTANKKADANRTGFPVIGLAI